MFQDSEAIILSQNSIKNPSSHQVLQMRELASKAWDQFYTTNTSNFFKDRHWPIKEFSDELDTKEYLNLLECGCGTGNLVFPLLQKTNFTIYCCDFSTVGIDLIRNNPLFDPKRVIPFVCDLTSNTLGVTVPDLSIDVVSMLFVLSAIPPDKMLTALRNIVRTMKSGSKLIFRDYGKYDAAQLRFKPVNFINIDSVGYYVRSDNTFSYFFTCQEIIQLFTSLGLTVLDCVYRKSLVANRKRQVQMERIFVQAKFIK